MGDFDRVVLAEALDARRVDLGITWRELAVQVTERPGRRSERRIAASTFKGMGQRQSVRDTVVLQPLRWLGRTPGSRLSVEGRASGVIFWDRPTAAGSRSRRCISMRLRV